MDSTTAVCAQQAIHAHLVLGVLAAAVLRHLFQQPLLRVWGHSTGKVLDQSTALLALGVHIISTHSELGV